MQFEQGYEAQFGIIDELEILRRMNAAMGSSLALAQINLILKTERTKNELAIAYRLLYDQEYERKINQTSAAEHVEHEFDGVAYDTFARHAGDDLGG